MIHPGVLLIGMLLFMGIAILEAVVITRLERLLREIGDAAHDALEALEEVPECDHSLRTRDGHAGWICLDCGRTGT